MTVEGLRWGTRPACRGRHEVLDGVGGAVLVVLTVCAMVMAVMAAAAQLVVTAAD